MDTTNKNRVQWSPTLLTTPNEEGEGERVRQVDVVNSKTKAFVEHSQEAAASSEVLGKKAGCGLSFVARKVREHYNDNVHKSDNLATHWQSTLEIEGESGALKLKSQALGKAAEHLRNASTLFNKVDTNLIEIEQIKENLTTYINLLALLFSSINVAVWTVAYEIPYQSSLFFNNYDIGSVFCHFKHSGIKHDLLLTNRSRSTSSLGKW